MSSSEKISEKKLKKKEEIPESQKTKFGESLALCSDIEWDKADPAYASELINVEKKANKVTVFTGPSAKTIERTIIRTDTLSEGLGIDDRFICEVNEDVLERKM